MCVYVQVEASKIIILVERMFSMMLTPLYAMMFEES